MLENGIGPGVCQRNESSWGLPALACSLLPRTGHVNKSLPTEIVALGAQPHSMAADSDERTGLQEAPAVQMYCILEPRMK